MTLSVNNYNTTYKNPFVQGAELQQASNNIFAAAQKVSVTSEATKTVAAQPTQTQNPNVIKLFSADTNTIKQIATSNANYDVNINANTQQAIQSLRAQAAQANISKTVEGKIYIPVEVAEKVQPKDFFTLTTKPETFDIGNMSKDRNGSNPFFVFAKAKSEKKEETEKQGLSLLA